MEKKKETYQPPHAEWLSVSSPLDLLTNLSFQGSLGDIEDDGEW